VRAWQAFGVRGLLLIVAFLFGLRSKGAELCCFPGQSVGQIDPALGIGTSADLLNTVCRAAAIQGRTPAEQTQFLTEHQLDGYVPSTHKEKS